MLDTPTFIVCLGLGLTIIIALTLDNKDTTVMEKEWDKKTWVEEATQNFEEALHEGSFDIAEDVLKDMREIVTKKELQELQSKLTAAKDTFKLEEESLDLV